MSSTFSNFFQIFLSFGFGIGAPRGARAELRYRVPAPAFDPERPGATDTLRRRNKAQDCAVSANECALFGGAKSIIPGIGAIGEVVNTTRRIFLCHLVYFLSFSIISIPHRTGKVKKNFLPNRPARPGTPWDRMNVRSAWICMNEKIFLKKYLTYCAEYGIIWMVGEGPLKLGRPMKAPDPGIRAGAPGSARNGNGPLSRSALFNCVLLCSCFRLARRPWRLFCPSVCTTRSALPSSTLSRFCPFSE